MITDLARRWSEQTANAAFVATDHGTYTFAEIWSLTRRFATGLRNHGIGTGDHVALIAGNSAAYVVAWLGINALGAVAVTLNDQLKGDAIDYSVGQSNSKLIVADSAWTTSRHAALKAERQHLPLVEIVSETGFLDTLKALEPGKVVVRDAADITSILYTSGTTGLPKGVLCTHGGHVAVGSATAKLLSLSAQDRTMLFMPLFHTNPQMYGVMSALTVGSSIALRPKFSAQNFFADARRFKATGCTFVGTVLSILAARYTDAEHDHALRFAVGGGTTRELADTIGARFGFRVHELYGMTETGGWTSGNSVADTRLGSNGKVRDDMDVAILDGDDRQLGPGQRGEIAVRPKQPHVMLAGYYRKADQMVAACRNLWFHTGDIGSFDNDGYLYFHGRSKELIRRAGEMISPVEIEMLLRKMPGIEDCAVVGVPDAIMGEEIKAVIVAPTGIEPQSVRGFLSDHLPEGLLPRYVEVRDSIPKTETEKILRRELEYLNDDVVDLLAGRAASRGNQWMEEKQ